MGDSESALPSSKKRSAERQITQLDPEPDDDGPELEMGTFQKASEEVLASRRMVKVRRHQPTSPPSINPFAGIRFVPPTDSGASDDEPKVAATVDDKEKSILGAAEGVENGGKKAETGGAGKETEVEVIGDGTEKENQETEKGNPSNDKKDAAATPFSSFQQLGNSQNAFTGLSGTGFSTSLFSFGGLTSEKSSFGIGSSYNGSCSLPLFGTSDSTISKGVTLPSMQEIAVETGEENEKAFFIADAVLYEYLEGGWKERGKGEVKLNASELEGVKKARLVMRTRGNYRLILNASLYPELTLARMDKRGITFACVNSAGEEGKNALTTFALKFRDATVADNFHDIVTLHKGEKKEAAAAAAAALKTPENSPKAADD